MTRNPAAGRGRWREGPASSSSGPSRTQLRTRKWTGAAILSLLLLAGLGVIVWLLVQFVFRYQPNPIFVPFWIANDKLPSTPWIEADQEALKRANLLARIDTTEDQIQDTKLTVMKTRLDDLQDVPPRESVVVYLSTHGMVDGTGEVQLVAGDSDPYQVKTMLPLQAVLAALRQCPARNKLLVLDVMQPSPHPLEVGGTPDGVADLIRMEVEGEHSSESTEANQDLLILAACSPGQTGLYSESLGQSVFGHFFRQAFFDPSSDTGRDGALSAKELAAYVADKVDRWAMQFRGTRQRPYLLGSGPDFDLAIPTANRPAPKAVETRPTSDEKKAETPAKSEGGEVAKTDEKTKAEPAEDPPGAYPRWLRDGWTARNDWWTDKTGRQFPGAAAPRAFRNLNEALVETELLWRLGKDPRGLETNLARTRERLRGVIERANTIPRPPARSVGQARAFGWDVDQDLAQKLRRLLEARRTVNPMNNPQAQEAQKKEAGEIIAALKAKENPSLELAGIIARAATEVRLDAETIGFLDSLLTESQVKLDVIELRLLRDLAIRAASPGDEPWSEETPALAFKTTDLAENAMSRPAALPWVRKLLNEAESLHHEAAVMLLSGTKGYVSWPQIQEAWRQAQSAFEFIKTCQDRIEESQTALARAHAILPTYLPYLRATRRANLENLWQDAATAATALTRKLAVPTASGGEKAPPALSHEEFEQLNNELTAATRDLQSPIDLLMDQFRGDAVQELISRSETPRPDPAAAAEIDAMLITPFLTAENRERIWQAGRALDERLATAPAPSISSTDGAVSTAGRVEQVRRVASHRGRRIAALLALCGNDETARGLTNSVELNNEVDALSRGSESDKGTDERTLAQVWSGIARIARLVHVDLVRMLEQRKNDGNDLAGWLAPAILLDLEVNPVHQARSQAAIRQWEWLADRYRHRDQDLHEQVEPSRFYEIAAAACPIPRLPDHPELELSLVSPEPPSLSNGQKSVTVGVRLLLNDVERGEPRKVRLSIEQVSDPRFQVSLATPEIELSPQSPKTADMLVQWDEDRVSTNRPPPPGFLLVARLSDDRSFHATVPLRLTWKQVLPKLMLSGSLESPAAIPFDTFRLRTLLRRQRFHVFVRNVAAQPRDVIVELLAGEAVIASSGEKPLTIPGNSTIPVPSFGGTPPKDEEPIGPMPANLRLRLREGTGTQILDVQDLAPTIEKPSDYLEVTQAQFIPADGPQPNQLRVDLRALPQMTGPPCPVELVLPQDPGLFPSLREQPQGRLSGELSPGGELMLSADAIKLDPNNPETGIFQLNLDGQKRSLWFQTKFVEGGRPQRAVEQTIPPRIRFHAQRIINPSEPAKLKIDFEADKVPPGTSLAFNLGSFQGQGEAKRFVTDHAFRDWTPKKHWIGFSPHGDKGALLFEAKVEDQTATFDVRGIQGRRSARAMLLDKRNNVIADDSQEIVLDDRPPRITTLQVPGEIPEGTPTIDVTCEIVPPASEITEVAFVVGTKLATAEEFAKAEADGKTIKGTAATPNDQRVWKAKVPIAKDASGRIVVSARATSGVGLSSLFGEAVEIKAKPRPTPAEEEAMAAKDAPPKPGSVEGTVFEGTVLQPGLTVNLYDPKPKDPEKPFALRAETDANGKFAFKDVPPGNYMLFCQKESSKRLAAPPVTVKPGEVTQVKLELLR